MDEGRGDQSWDLKDERRGKMRLGKERKEGGGGGGGRGRSDEVRGGVVGGRKGGRCKLMCVREGKVFISPLKTAGMRHEEDRDTWKQTDNKQTERQSKYSPTTVRLTTAVVEGDKR